MSKENDGVPALVILWSAALGLKDCVAGSGRANMLIWQMVELLPPHRLKTVEPQPPNLPGKNGGAPTPPSPWKNGGKAPTAFRSTWK